MMQLVLVSLIWAFSFGLIGNTLAGLPSAWVGWVRLGLSALVFLPFVRRVPARQAAFLVAIGAVQFGVMYWAYLSAFRFLQSHEVALFTVTTPILVALLADAGSRRFRLFNWLAAVLAVAGAAVVKWTELETVAPWRGFLLVQLSNLCFAAGQLAYRAVLRRLPQPVVERKLFFWLHAGGMLALTPAALPWLRHAPATSPAQWATLAYLGIIASGLCFFWWNQGARRVSAGRLAVLNNLKIPLGVAVSLLVFRESAQLGVLLVGSVLLAVALVPVWRQRSP